MSLTRRTFLTTASAAIAGASLSFSSKPKPFRVVFLTDIHLPAEGQNDRVRKCLDKALAESPDLILLGGDQVMDVDRGSSYAENEANAQFDNFKSVVMSRFKKTDVAAVLGNHDIWHNSKDKGIATYGMPHRFYRKDVGGWRFLMLDTFHEDRTCQIDKEQMAWLKDEILGTKKPILLLSHAPILTVTSFIENEVANNGAFAIPNRWQVANLKDLRDLFFDQPHVRLALSGHMHQMDHCKFDGVSYICGGAVCGNWWQGSFHRFPPAFMVFDLETNGSFRHRSVSWKSVNSQVHDLPIHS